MDTGKLIDKILAALAIVAVQISIVVVAISAMVPDSPWCRGCNGAGRVVEDSIRIIEGKGCKVQTVRDCEWCRGTGLYVRSCPLKHVEPVFQDGTNYVAEKAPPWRTISFVDSSSSSR